MTRSFRTPFGAAVAALALSACGGGAGSLPATQQLQAPNTNARHVSSTCTPDSYGYCLKLVRSFNGPTGECRVNQQVLMYQQKTYVYELYHNGADQGEYDDSNADGGGPGCPPALIWTPQDPRAATGDPNLP